MLRKKRKFRYPRIKRRRSNAKKLLKPKIHERPNNINSREEFGHYEGDLILFSKTKTNLITMRERKSRYLVAIKNQNKQADSTAKLIVKHMKQKHIKSLTLDNGTEFANYAHISESLMIDIYFYKIYDFFK